MTITVAMVITYILFCIRVGTKPCKYFQLNSERFDRDEGIFSKLAIDQSIPERWRLDQRPDDPDYQPTVWPVFVKPEWGQNAAGIRRADDLQQLEEIRRDNAKSGIRYLLQQGATEKREFEIFSIRQHDDKGKPAVLTVTEAVNESETNPINSIYNPATRYVEITEMFNEEQLATLWRYANDMGRFNISRASVRANTLEDLVAGKFHVIEVNLFLPMPINLLDQRYSPRQIFSKVRSYMLSLARLTRTRDKSLPEKPVFCKIMLYNRTSPFLNFLRSKI